MKTKISKIIKPLSEVDKAYLAGIMDGEGSISISRKTDPTMKSGFSFRPCIEISNTDKPLMDWIASTTGLGAIRLYVDHNPKHRPAYKWSLWSNQANQFLNAIRPYLITKRERADIVIEFIKAHSGGKAYLTTEQIASQTAIYDQMKALNKRGPR